MAIKKEHPAERSRYECDKSPSADHSYGDQHEPKQEDPWPIDDYPEPSQDCKCQPPPPPPPNRPRPDSPQTTPKGDDCCQQILEVLHCIPGIDEKCLKLRKPKTPPKVKIANFVWGVAG